MSNTIEDAWAACPPKSIAKLTAGTPTNTPAGRWRALYDDTNVYFLVEVNDTKAWGNPNVGNFWDGDAVEIYFRRVGNTPGQWGYAYRNNGTVGAAAGEYAQVAGDSYMWNVVETYNGKLADPGAYFYSVELPDGNVKKGAIEVVRVK